MKKVFAVVLVALLVTAMFAGCGKQKNTDPKVLKIGMSAPLTGGAAVYGTAVEAGMKIAVEEINAKAGDDGLKIEFQSQDDEHDNEKAINAYNNLKDWGMQVFAGAVTTGPCLSIASEAVSDEIFMMTPSGSSEKIVKTGSNIYQMCFTDPNQGANAAKLVAEKKLGTKIGIIYNNSDDYSKGLTQGFKDEATTLGMNIVCETSFTDDNKSDLSSQVQQCKDAACDFVFLPFYATEAAQVLTYANKIGYEPTFFGCDGMDGILAIDGFDTKLAEGLVMITPFNADATDETTQNFVTKYKEMMNGEVPNQFAADGYDVIYCIYNACVEKGIDGTTSAKDACALLVEYMSTATFNGLTGTGMTWNGDGMISKVPAAVVIRNGKYMALKTE